MVVESKQRIALVTGGMGGLGEAICIKLAALGYKVVTTYSPGNTKAQEWLDDMTELGYGFHAYPCDVADFDSCTACVAADDSATSARSTCWSTTPASRAT